MLIDIVIIVWVVSTIYGFFCIGRKLGGFIYAKFFYRPTKVIVTELDGTVKEYLLNEEEAKAFVEECYKHKL